ncbi:hypothetical protein PBY51_017519 [Eleginops maclovinus]|uniref:Uncharacterized protein n=1 Tax=Eleginops maclovinus TaxID=56733 RepID=A0AAN7XJV6_ELEMC|nr:hypothetical protein PBY51_017519 [Eleginops maclovinus]
MSKDNRGGRGGLKEPVPWTPLHPKWFVTASLPLSSNCIQEQVTSYCVPLIKLKHGWMDGLIDGGGALPSPPPSTSTDEEHSLLCSLLITEHHMALAANYESEPAFASETGQEVKRGGGLGYRKESGTK